MSEKKYSREEIIEALEKKGAKKPCHRCGNPTFALIDSFSKMPLYEDTESNTSNSHVPVVLVGCDNCGAITSHALFALFERDDVENADKKEGGENG